MHAKDVLGKSGEQVAAEYLESCGLRILDRNWRCAVGEIDIVAWHGEKLVFVEVKTRASGEFGDPDRAVDMEKRDRVMRAARDYVRRAGVPWDRVRFDTLSVTLQTQPIINWTQDAF